ncbi:MAG: arsenate reductase ArsC [Vicinamibacterales bacterium]
MDRLRVLFLCTGNAARSQMAEALLRKLSGDGVDVFSAGTHPEPMVHPVARDVLQEQFDIDPAGLRPKHMNRFAGEPFDFVITVCDRAAETCPAFPGDPDRIHWSFEDPAIVQEGPAQRRAFETVANGLAARLRIWMALPSIRERLEAIQKPEGRSREE